MISTQSVSQNSFYTLPARKAYTSTTVKVPIDNLLNLLQQKSERGFSQLYDNYADALFSVTYQIVKNKEIAEDLLQDIFVKIWKKIDTYHEARGTLYTWMLNIARNTSIDFVRSQKNRFYQHFVHDDILLNESYQRGNNIENADHLDYIAIKNKAAKLDQKYADVIDLIYFEGYTYEQVAIILNLPLGTVKTRGRNALTILKNAYK